MFTLLGVVLAPLINNYFDYIKFNQVLSLTQTAEASSISIIPNASTPILSPKTAGTTIAPDDSVLLQDNFIDNRNDWLIQDSPDIQSEIAGGKYSNSINCPLSNTPETCSFHLSGPSISAKDFQLEIDVAISKNKPDGQVYFGIDFRRIDEFYYVIYFRDNLGFMNLVQNTGLNSLIKEATAPTIDITDGAVNRYGFIANGTQFELLANGQSFATVQDGSINRAGRIYFLLIVSDGVKAKIDLDNLVINRIP